MTLRYDTKHVLITPRPFCYKPRLLCAVICCVVRKEEAMAVSEEEFQRLQHEVAALRAENEEKGTQLAVKIAQVSGPMTKLCNYIGGLHTTS